MRVKLPENFGGLSLAGANVKIDVEEDGCAEITSHEVAAALLEHGAVPVPAAATKKKKSE